MFERFDGEGEESRFARPPRFASAAGGLVSTADDYLAFARMMLGGGVYRGRRILSEASVRAMQADRIPAEVKARSPFGPGFWDTGGWGLGMQVVTPARAGRAGRLRLGRGLRHQRLLGSGVAGWWGSI